MFIEIKADHKSLRQRKLIHGVGVNDALYQTKIKVNGVYFRCPFYQRWKCILTRCYSEYALNRDGSYSDCHVCDEWLLFSNFKSWMENQDWIGKEIDKDLLIQGNKMYSPEACVFITKDINVLLTNSKSSRGEYPLGVSVDGNDSKKYRAKCNYKGKCKSLGRYSTIKEASAAYKTFKYKVIKEAAMTQLEPIRSALLNYNLEDFHAYS